MIFRFGTHELDVNRFELRKNGHAIAVEPQVFSIIQLLIENRDRMVTKSELVDAIWNGRVVSESAISSRVRSARLALDDDGLSQNIIQTVHGKGLRFVAKVEEGQGEAPPASAETNTPKSPQPDPVSQPDAQSSEARPSIAVLPFENLGPNREDEFFAAGLTEDVITNLSRFRDLFVYSRSTTTALSGEGLSVRDIHQRLGTDFVLEGSVRKSADTVRVTFKLVDAVSDGNILVERLEDACTLENIFDIQEKIALRIAGRIANRRQLLSDPKHLDANRKRATNWGTYHCITQYYEYMITRDLALHAAVRDGLEVALANDPRSSDGSAALAVVLLDEYRFGYNLRRDYPVLDEAYKHAKRAISIDIENAFAHQALAMVQFHRREFADFLASSERSIKLNPGKADALAAFGCCYYLAGQFEKALPLLDQAMELNPLENGAPRLVRAGCHFVEGRYAGAFQDIRQADLPGLAWYHAYFAAISYAFGDETTAKAQAQLIIKEFPDFMDQTKTLKEVLNISDEVHTKFAEVWQKVFALLKDGERAASEQGNL